MNGRSLDRITALLQRLEEWDDKEYQMGEETIALDDCQELLLDIQQCLQSIVDKELE